MYTLKKFTNYEAGYSVEVMIININLYLRRITAHYDAPRSIFLCVEKPKNETLKLKLQNCIYSKAQWPKWHANVTSWCCHRKKRPS